MTSYELSGSIQKLTESLSPDLPFRTQLRKFIDGGRKLNLTLTQLLQQTQKPATDAAGHLSSKQREVTTIIDELRQIDPYETLTGISALFAAFSDYMLRVAQLNSERSLMLLRAIENFRGSYVAFIQKATLETAVEASLDARALETSLDTVSAALFGIASQLPSIAETAPTKSGELSLVFDSDQQPDDVSRKLHALAEMYSDFCALVGISPKDEPMHLMRLETGSLWAKLFGNSKVIDLMLWSIKSGAGYVHRTFMAEGRIATIPQDPEVIESILVLRTRLEANDVDTKKLTDQIKKTSVQLADRLNALLQGESNVAINGESQVLVPEARSSSQPIACPLPPPPTPPATDPKPKHPDPKVEKKHPEPKVDKKPHKKK
jgi:hypothetical protein